VVDLSLIEMFGWVGGILLAVCAAPQAVLCHKNGHSNGISLSFLLMWFFGEIFLTIYVFPKMHYPLIANYILNIFIAGIILWYKIKPREHLSKISRDLWKKME